MPALGLSAVPSPTKNRISAAIGSADAADADSIAVEALSRPALSGAALSVAAPSATGAAGAAGSPVPAAAAGMTAETVVRDSRRPAHAATSACDARTRGVLPGSESSPDPDRVRGSEPETSPLGSAAVITGGSAVATSTATPSVRTTAESDPSPAPPGGESAEESPASALSSNRASSAEADWRGATTANSVGDDTAGFVPTSSPDAGTVAEPPSGGAPTLMPSGPAMPPTAMSATASAGGRTTRVRRFGPATPVLGPAPGPPAAESAGPPAAGAPVARWAPDRVPPRCLAAPAAESLEPELCVDPAPFTGPGSAAATAGSSAITTPMPSAMASAPTRPTKCVGRGAGVRCQRPALSWVTRSVPVAGRWRAPCCLAPSARRSRRETLSGHITDLRWPPDRHALCQHDLAAHGKDQRVRTRGIWCSPTANHGQKQPPPTLPSPSTQQTLAVSYITPAEGPEPIRDAATQPRSDPAHCRRFGVGGAPEVVRCDAVLCMPFPVGEKIT